MRLVLISDTHSRHLAMPPLPAGDVLVHAGDLTALGSLDEISGFMSWFAAQPHPHKVFIAGNHDFAFERSPAAAEALVPSGVTYLRDSGCVIDGVPFWGSPWQPWFHDWAFNLERGAALAAKWALIPDDVQVLVTHGPPEGMLDTVAFPRGAHVGCEALAARILALRELRVHGFGHIHEAYGAEVVGGVTYVNASVCDLDYRPVNAPVCVDL